MFVSEQSREALTEPITHAHHARAESHFQFLKRAGCRSLILGDSVLGVLQFTYYVTILGDSVVVRLSALWAGHITSHWFYAILLQ